MSSLSAGGDKSKATQPFLFLQELAQICLVLVPLSTGHFPACQFGPRHNPFPIILNFAGAKSEFRNLEINVITVICTRERLRESSKQMFRFTDWKKLSVFFQNNNKNQKNWIFYFLNLKFKLERKLVKPLWLVISSSLYMNISMYIISVRSSRIGNFGLFK